MIRTRQASADMGLDEIALEVRNGMRHERWENATVMAGLYYAKLSRFITRYSKGWHPEGMTTVEFTRAVMDLSLERVLCEEFREPIIEVMITRAGPWGFMGSGGREILGALNVRLQNIEFDLQRIVVGEDAPVDLYRNIGEGLLLLSLQASLNRCFVHNILRCDPRQGHVTVGAAFPELLPESGLVRVLERAYVQRPSDTQDG